ncbi:TetR/AcrR family transcriptional regulator [Lacticaseibacillus zhaodongensis]|uniref:TetR/AcrR family transcriptional regulator n=1 Tax=Lacticaseibacillus zhaodongensis TaxID=2668065 RepID=UPI0012D2AAB7|nr:TetR/AcrR family transcriptional regulator [Lacticaseibacillus zhaodongensis]
MVLSTFEHIPPAKQDRVRQALLNEFSHYSLAQAQVARIVKDAGIARGAFYKYFADLTDAYNYVFAEAMRTLHQRLPQRPTLTNSDQYIDAIKQLLLAADEAGYRQLFTMHYRYNEACLGNQPSSIVSGADGPTQWAMTILYHQTVRDIILDPDSMDQRLAQLRSALQNQ